MVPVGMEFGSPDYERLMQERRLQHLISQVCLQAVQKLKTPVHAFVAGNQHFKRRLQSHCWRAMTGQVIRANIVFIRLTLQRPTEVSNLKSGHACSNPCTRSSGYRRLSMVGGRYLRAGSLDSADYRPVDSLSALQSIKSDTLYNIISSILSINGTRTRGMVFAY